MIILSFHLLFLLLTVTLHNTKNGARMLYYSGHLCCCYRLTMEYLIFAKLSAKQLRSNSYFYTQTRYYYLSTFGSYLDTHQPHRMSFFCFSITFKQLISVKRHCRSPVNGYDPSSTHFNASRRYTG